MRDFTKQRSIIYLAAFLMLMCLYRPAAADKTVHGTITDKATGASLNEATVSFYQGSDTKFPYPELDVDGSYSVELPDSWAGNVIAKAYHYQQKKMALNLVFAGPDTTVDFKLDYAARKIHGVVRDSQSGQEVAKVELTWTNAETGEKLTATTKSGSDKSYELFTTTTDPWFGNVNLWLPGYVEKNEYVIVDNYAEDFTKDFTLDPNIDPDGTKISGDFHVYDENGIAVDPPYNFMVKLFLLPNTLSNLVFPNPDSSSDYITVDPNLSYSWNISNHEVSPDSLDDLLFATYAEGYRVVTPWKNSQGTPPGETMVYPLSEMVPRSDNIINLSARKTYVPVTGIVQTDYLDPNGPQYYWETLYGATVSGFPGGPTTSGGGGEFSAPVPWAWSGTITASHDCKNPASHTYSYVHFSPNPEYFNLEQIMVPVDIFVRDDDGAAVPGVVVTAQPDGYQRVTDGAGKAAFHSLPCGWTGRFTGALDGYLIDDLTLTVPEAGGWSATMNAHAITDIRIDVAYPDGVAFDRLITASVTGLPDITSSNGTIILTVLNTWSGTITPAAQGFTFNPASITISDPASESGPYAITALPTAAPVTLTSPTGGAPWHVGDTMHITWNVVAHAAITGQSVYVSVKPHGPWLVLDDALPTDARAMDWTIQTTSVDQAQIIVEVEGAAPLPATVMSDPFEIRCFEIALQTPNTNATYDLGENLDCQVTVTQSQLCPAPDDFLWELTYDDGTTWTILGTSTTGTFSWPISGQTSYDCRVRVTATNGNQTQSVQSAETFRIRDPSGGGGCPGCPPVQSSPVPTVTRLINNAPNPFTSSTTVYFDLAEAAATRIEVYNVAGRRVRLEDLGTVSPGRRTWFWDGGDDAGHPVRSGIYYLRFTAGTTVGTRKMLLLR